MSKKTQRRPPAHKPHQAPARAYAILTGEDEAAARADRDVRTRHAEGIALLVELAAGANNLAGFATRSNQLQVGADSFRLAVLVQQQNVAWSALRLLRTGYPRIALNVARLQLEYHKAFVWGCVFPDKARELWPDGASAPLEGRGLTAGQMGKAVEKTIGRESPAFPPELMNQLSKIHNTLFAHAMSDWALLDTFSREPDDPDAWRVNAGPSYNAHTVKMCIEHLVPLSVFTVADAGELFVAFTGEPISVETLGLLQRGMDWIERFGIPLLPQRLGTHA